MLPDKPFAIISDSFQGPTLYPQMQEVTFPH
jgi:hypothetical protein